MSNNVLIKNKKGYKKTKLGWIPEDWEVIKLGSIIEESTLKSSVENQLPVLTSSRRGLMYQTDYYNEQNVIFNKNNIGFNILPKGYITYRSRSDDGFFTFNLNKLADGIVSIYYPVFKTKFNDYFICSLLNISSKILYKYAIGSSQKVLAINDLSKILYAIPKIEEQEKIAEILSAWDDGIETLEKLIEQKEISHKALMKNLLIGKKRFVEFRKNSEYKRTKLGSIPVDWQIKPLKLLFDKRMQKYSRDTEHNIFTNSATKGVVLQNEYFDRSIVTEENTSNYYVVGKDDFMYNPRISQNAPAGPINRNKLGITGIASPLYTIFKAKHDTIVDFYEQYFSSNLWNNSMFMVANQGARHDRLNITNNDFMNMPLPYPPLKEQKKIANVLIESYKEIQILNSKLEKLKEQKKGLMQKLLTGQIRVKV